jgi:hypothetical protein
MIKRYNFNRNFLKITRKKFKNLLKKRKIIEGSVSKIVPIQLRYLKPREDFTSTKKKFGYRSTKQYSIKILDRKIKKFYSSQKYELNSKYVYYFPSKLKKANSTKKWYILYNWVVPIQRWVLKNKQNKYKKRLNAQFILQNNSKFQTVSLTNNSILRVYQTKLTYRSSLLRPYFKALRSRTSHYQVYFQIKKSRKYLRTLKVKRGVLLFLLKKLNNCAITLNTLPQRGLELIAYTRELALKYRIKFEYLRFLIEISYRLFKKTRKVYYCFAKHLIHFFYKRMFRLSERIEPTFQLKKYFTQLGTETVYFSNRFIATQTKVFLLGIGLFRTKTVLKLFFNYLVFCILFKKNLMGFIFKARKTQIGSTNLFIITERNKHKRSKLDYFTNATGYLTLLSQLRYRKVDRGYLFKHIAAKLDAVMHY